MRTEEIKKDAAEEAIETIADMNEVLAKHKQQKELGRSRLRPAIGTIAAMGDVLANRQKTLGGSPLGSEGASSVLRQSNSRVFSPIKSQSDSPTLTNSPDSIATTHEQLVGRNPKV